MIKVKLLLIISILLFSWGFSYAVDQITTGWVISTSWTSVGEIVYWIINFLNIIWLPFAILAWKLFTNDLVYGTFLHMDVILWKIWNFSKTLALFIIAFGFIFSIFRYFFSKEDILKNIGKFALAAILVPLSWWLIGVLIDLSSLLLYSVGNFPMKILSNSDVIQAKKISVCTNVVFSGDLKISSDMIHCDQTKKIDLLKYMDKANNLSSSLIFLGQSVLFLDRNWSDISTKNLKQQGKNPAKAISLSLVFKLIVLVLFVVPLVILIIIWIIRVFWLWIYIGFSPLIILDQIFWWKIFWQKKEFKFSNMIWLIFQPVLVVFATGVILVFIAVLRDIMVVDYQTWQHNKVMEKEIGLCDNNWLCIEWKKILTIKTNFFKDFIEEVGWFMWYLIFLILVSVFMFSLIWVVVKSSDLTSSAVDSVYKFSKRALEAIPVFPAPGGMVWYGALKKTFDKALLKSDFDAKAAQQASWLVDKVYKALWVKNSDLDIWTYTSWVNELKVLKTPESIIRQYLTYLDTIVKSDKYKDMIIQNSPYFKQFTYSYFEKLFDKSSNKHIFVNLGMATKDKNWNIVFVNDIDKLFNNSHFRSFLTALIKEVKSWNTSIFSSTNISILSSQVPRNVPDLTSIPLSKWDSRN